MLLYTALITTMNSCAISGTYSATCKLKTFIDVLKSELDHRAVSKRYKMLGFLRRHMNKDFDINCRKALYLTLIRLTIGYATQVRAPS